MKQILVAVLSALAVTSLCLFGQDKETGVSRSPNLRENDETDRFLVDNKNNGTPRKVVVSYCDNNTNTLLFVVTSCSSC